MRPDRQPIRARFGGKGHERRGQCGCLPRRAASAAKSERDQRGFEAVRSRAQVTVQIKCESDCGDGYEDESFDCEMAFMAP
jgi:hypothetical protein